jgi:hypothetical protein
MCYFVFARLRPFYHDPHFVVLDAAIVIAIRRLSNKQA